MSEDQVSPFFFVLTSLICISVVAAVMATQ